MMTGARRNRGVRRGFTLVELMLALTLTAMAAAMAGVSMVAAQRTGERVSAHKEAGESELRFRAMLADLLRHAPAGDRVSEPLLQLQRDVDGTRLVFLTTGVQLPLGTGPVWRATVQMDNGVLRLDASPVRADVRAAPITMQLSGLDAFEVDVLEPVRAGEAAAWRVDWPLAQTRPAAITLRWQRAGKAGAPMVLVLDPLGAMEGAP